MSPKVQTSAASLSNVVTSVDDDDSVETVSTFISCCKMLYLSHSGYVTCFNLYLCTAQSQFLSKLLDLQDGITSLHGDIQHLLMLNQEVYN
jgi:hypothetical protein